MVFIFLNLRYKICFVSAAAPEFIREPSDVAADIGLSVSLLCLVQGHPEPEVTWRRQDYVDLFNTPRTQGSITQSKEGLQITSKFVAQILQ